VPISVLKNDLAQAELGWNPIVKMEEGIARTVKWMKENQMHGGSVRPQDPNR
jgi:nucleoside-diphosphate-sugar epimerase